MAVDPARRRFLRDLASLPLAGGLAALSGRIGFPATPGEGPASPSRAMVVSARREGLLGEKRALDPAKLEEMLGSALRRVTGEPTPVTAMKRLFKPSDVVGIKLNCLGGPTLSPKVALVDRLSGWIREAGVPARNILLMERSDRELMGAGYAIARGGDSVRCFGVEKDYDWTPREWGAGGSCFARVLVEEITALVNVPVLKDHDLAGVSGGMKNWYGVIHNPNKHHADGCAPYIPHLAAYPLIRDKLRLTLVDAIVAQCHGGPAANPRWQWRHEGILVSTDPVACDAVAWRMIEGKRREMKLPPLSGEKREPIWIRKAGELGLGEANPDRIEVVNV